MSRLLVDTHALLWWLTDDASLSAIAREALIDPANEPLVSAASVWEIAVKRSLGKLTAPDHLPDLVVDEGFSWLPISPVHAWQVRTLPLHHRDPFDRLLVAQASIEGAAIVSRDDALRPYGITLIW